MPHLFHDFSAAHFSFYWELKAVAFQAHRKTRLKYLFINVESSCFHKPDRRADNIDECSIVSSLSAFISRVGQDIPSRDTKTITIKRKR